MKISLYQKLQKFLVLFSAEKALSDQLFFFTFYLCAGFLPPLIGIFGHKAVHAPLIIISLFIILRIVIRKDTRKTIFDTITKPAPLLLISFASLILFQALSGAGNNPDFIRTLSKPLQIFLFLSFLIYIWSFRDQLRIDLLFKCVLLGVLTGILIITLKLIVTHILGVGYQQNSSFFTSFLDINEAINDELNILTIFSFIAVFAIKSHSQRYIVLIAILASLFSLSFFTIGFGLKTEADKTMIYKVYSESVQFGIPLALCILALAWKIPKRIITIFFTGLAFILLNAPWLFQLWFYLIKTVALPRADIFLVRGDIWNGVAKKIFENPLFGHGIDSARSGLTINIDNLYYPKDTIHHPHNMALQLWLDLGFIGVAIIMALLFLSWRAVRNIEVLDEPFIFGGLTMLVILTLVSHSIWQTWSMALITHIITLIFLSYLSHKKTPSDNLRANSA